MKKIMLSLLVLGLVACGETASEESVDQNNQETPAVNEEKVMQLEEESQKLQEHTEKLGTEIEELKSELDTLLTL